MNFRSILIERRRLAGAVGRAPIMVGDSKWFAAPSAEELFSQMDSLQSASKALDTPLSMNTPESFDIMLGVREEKAEGNKSTWPRSMVLIC